MAELTLAEVLTELEHSQNQVVRLLEAMAPIQDWQPEPVEWSFRFIAAHLATVERTCHLPRVKAIASGDTPTLALYTNTAADYQDADIHASLQDWVATRQSLIGYVKQLSPRQLTYIGIHESLGPMTVHELLRELLRQDKGNLRHVRQLIIAYQEDQQPTREAL